ncbi:unnamed protein product [Scytosiphon promiscuus]
MAGKRARIALLVDGEEPFELPSSSGGEPGLLLGRGGQSSPFLRSRLGDASISREHIRIEAVSDFDDGAGDSEEAAADATAAPSAAARPSARMTVVGSNPILLVRGKPPGGKTLVHRGQSVVAEDGDGFTFCRGFEGVVRVAAVSPHPDGVRGKGGDDRPQQQQRQQERRVREEGEGRGTGPGSDHRQPMGDRDGAGASGVSRSSCGGGGSGGYDGGVGGGAGDGDIGGGGEDGGRPGVAKDELYDGSRAAAGEGDDPTVRPSGAESAEQHLERGVGQAGGEHHYHTAPLATSEGVVPSDETTADDEDVDSGVGVRDRASGGGATPLAGLRVALVGGGFSKQRQRVFRQRALKLGMEVLLRPSSKADVPPSLFDLLPGGGPTPAGKGKKRARQASSNGRHRQRGDHSLSPPAPRRRETGSGSGSGGGDGDSGGGGLLEEFRREGVTVAVCSSSAAPPWIELLGSASSGETAAAKKEGVQGAVPPESAVTRGGGGDDGEGDGGSGRPVEVVRDEWLSSCLQQKRRVSTMPYLLSPPEVGLRGEGEVDGEKAGGGEGGEGEARDPAFVVPMYACQRPTPMRHHNHELTDVVDEMSGMYKVIGDTVRADSFQRLSSILRFLDRRVRAGSEIAHVHHVGAKMVEFVDEILDTKTLSRLTELKANPQNMVCKDLMRVHGVGAQTAKQWYNRGIRSVEQAQRELLPKEGVDDDDANGGDQRNQLKRRLLSGLAHNELHPGVPLSREEVVGIADEVRKEAERFGSERDPEGTVLFEVCGGFRRGKEELHDVDLLVSFRRSNGEPGHQGFFSWVFASHVLPGPLTIFDSRSLPTNSLDTDESNISLPRGLKEILVEKGKLCATLFQGHMGGFTKKKNGVETNPPKFEREQVLMALWQLPGRVCRIDIVQVALPQWPFALLGWSGTVMFEKEVRRYTDEQTEYKLSQKGLVIRDTDTPLSEVVIKTEEDIFSFLGLDYIPVHPPPCVPTFQLLLFSVEVF